MARAVEPDKLRRRLEVQARLLFHAPRRTQMQWHVLEASQRRIDALEVVPENLTGDGVILYIHGGGFVFGSPKTHAAMVAQIAARLKVRAVLPRYRLAPEAPYPAAPQDVRTAWDALCASGVPAERVILGGDSAGGTLVLGLLAELCAEGAKMPAAVFCLSPLTDMTCSGESFEKNARREAVLPPHRAAEMAGHYLGTHKRNDWRVSPLRASFDGAAPIWLTVGDTEILYDDTRRLAAKLTEQGVDVVVREEHDLPHVWPLFHNILPEARQSLDDLAAWIRQQPGWQDES